MLEVLQENASVSRQYFPAPTMHYSLFLQLLVDKVYTKLNDFTFQIVQNLNLFTNNKL